MTVAFKLKQISAKGKDRHPIMQRECLSYGLRPLAVL